GEVVEDEPQVLALAARGAVAGLLLGAAARGGDDRQHQGGAREGPSHDPPRWAVRGVQSTTRRSSSANSPYRAMASANSSTVAANARAVSSWPLAISRVWPSPRSEPAHSANTAPITATAAAIFTPVNVVGSALGASSRRRRCQRVASSERSSLRASGSTSRSP